MASVTYPPAPVTITGDLESANRFLATPALIRKRLRDITQDRFIGDYLLGQPGFTVVGGAVLYETQGESIYANRTPQIIAPLAEYPLTDVGTGPASVAAVNKWGLDSPISDESIKRRAMDVVNPTLEKLTNTMIRTADQVVLSAIASVVTQTIAASAPFATATATQFVQDVGRAVNLIKNQNLGYNPNALVINDGQWLAMYSKLLDASYLSRENNTVASGPGLPLFQGLTIISTPNVPVSGAAFVVDTSQLGGMADENLGGPGYVGRRAGVDGKAIRNEERDGWLLRVRRVFVPIITDPLAACTITGIGAGIV